MVIVNLYIFMYLFEVCFWKYLLKNLEWILEAMHWLLFFRYVDSASFSVELVQMAKEILALKTSVQGTGRYSISHQNRKGNNNPASNPSVYDCNSFFSSLLFWFFGGPETQLPNKSYGGLFFFFEGPALARFNFSQLSLA